MQIALELLQLRLGDVDEPLNFATETVRRRMKPGSQGRLWPSIIWMPKISTGVPTMPAIPGGAGTQLGRLNRISTKPKARSPKASMISPMEMRLALGLVDHGAQHRGSALVLRRWLALGACPSRVLDRPRPPSRS